MNDLRIGQQAKYIGPEKGMQIQGVIFAVDDKHIWIRDSYDRERGCLRRYVRLLPTTLDASSNHS